MKLSKHIILPAFALIALVLLPFFVNAERSYLISSIFLCFCYIIIGQAWNLVAGYTGQISLGQHAFFGLGAYTTALIWLHDVTKTGYYFDPVTMFLSGLVPAIIAVIVGIPLLSRLKGDYFALGTLGMGEIIKVIFVKGGSFTGASDGLHLPSGIYSSIMPYYWTGMLLALFATLVVYFMIRSHTGLALKAIREDETAAAARGINVLKFKVLAFSVGAFLAGLGGSLYGIYLFHINPESVLKLDWTLYPILLCVIGGAGTIAGPLLGAVFISIVFSVADIYFVQMHPVMAGILIIVVMKYMPKGLIGLIQKK